MTKAGEKLIAGLTELLGVINGHACNCIGPQIGQPVCPCRMRSVTIENGRYIERHDLGPAPSGEETIGNPQHLKYLFSNGLLKAAGAK